MAAPEHPVSLADAFSRVDDRWSPKVVAEVNDQLVKVVKVEGDFVWHRHEDLDELFLVRSGTLVIDVRDRDPVVLGPGELFVVPRGVEHRPRAEGVCELVLLEPAGVVNTGDAEPGDRRAPVDAWL